MVGVSTRKYARSLELLPKELDAYGTSNSAVSRRFVTTTAEQVDKFLSRSLSDLSLCAVMLDGVQVGKHVLLLAIGIDTQGNKQVLGVREGATGNAVSCRELLVDLRERGLCTARSLLFAPDGGKPCGRLIPVPPRC